MRRFVLGGFAALATMTASQAYAGDLGTHGQTFAVSETDILTQIGRQLRRAEASGRMEALQRDFQERVRRKVERPVPVAGIVKTVEPRSWLFDPSIVVPQDFADPQGRVFARAGQRINPLDRLPGFDRVMLFIDGDDRHQVDWALGEMDRIGEHRVRIILTNGAPLELMRNRRRQFFFDQEARITGHFGIRQVPARVERENDRMRISELKL